MMVTEASAESEKASLPPRERALLERCEKLTFNASNRLDNSWIS